MAQPAIGQLVVVTLGTDEYAGEVLHVDENEVRVAIKMRVPAKGVLPSGGTVTWVDGRQQPFSPPQAECLATIEITLPLNFVATAERPPEQRRFVRLERRVAVDLSELTPPGRLLSSGYTIDFSGGGAKLELNRPVQEGANYLMTLYLPEEVFRLEINILRVKREDAVSVCAVRFENISEADRSKIIRSIFSRLRSLRDPAAAPRIDRDKFKLPSSRIRYR